MQPLNNLKILAMENWMNLLTLPLMSHFQLVWPASMRLRSQIAPNYINQITNLTTTHLKINSYLSSKVEIIVNPSYLLSKVYVKSIPNAALHAVNLHNGSVNTNKPLSNCKSSTCNNSLKNCKILEINQLSIREWKEVNHILNLSHMEALLLSSM